MATSLTPFPYTISSVTGISPLTYRDAETFLEQLETLKHWLATVNIPEVEAALLAKVEEFQEGIANAEATVTAAKEGWQILFDEFMANVAANIGVINQAVIDGRITVGIAGKLDVTVAADTYQTKLDAVADGIEALETFETKANAGVTYATKTQTAADIAAGVGAAVAEIKRDPMASWKAAVKNQATTPAVYLNLGDSIANGGNPTKGSLAWLNRVAALYTNRVADRLEGEPLTLPYPNGVHIYNGAVGGRTSANYLSDALIARIGQITPDLISHMVKANDQAQGISPNAFRANLKSWIDKAIVASPNSLHLIINQHRRIDLPTPAFPDKEYRDAMLSLANEYGDKAVFLDIGDEFLSHGMPNTDRYSLMKGDGLHFEDDGNRVYARIISRFMGAPVIDYLPREILRAPSYVTTNMTPASNKRFATITVYPKPYARRGIGSFNIYGLPTGTSVDAIMGFTPAGGSYNDVLSARLEPARRNHSGDATFFLEPNTEYAFTLDIGIYGTDAFDPSGSSSFYNTFYVDMSPA